ALNNKKSEINGATNIDQPTKDKLIKEATEAANTAKDNIAKANTNDGATKAGQDGAAAIEKVVPTSLEDAKKAANDAIDGALNNKKSEINGATN
ncbi:DUF1542 domain-containing protein, partial [Lactobacillus gallinarum]|uniref:DUF1542 domain-containing protein n=1 Tax=Lactobacillus gallinarum TaxID=52242 RepID=UPI00195D0CE2